MITDDVIHERNLLGLRVGFAAATPEELAVELEIPPEALARTVHEYNEAAARGEDPRFRKRAPFLQPIGVPRRAASAPSTCGSTTVPSTPPSRSAGLVTDPEGAALDPPVTEYLVSTQSGGRPPAWRPVARQRHQSRRRILLRPSRRPSCSRPGRRAPLRSRRDRFTAATHTPAGRPGGRGGGELAVASWLVWL